MLLRRTENDRSLTAVRPPNFRVTLRTSRMGASDSVSPPMASVVGWRAGAGIPVHRPAGLFRCGGRVFRAEIGFQRIVERVLPRRVMRRRHRAGNDRTIGMVAELHDAFGLV